MVRVMDLHPPPALHFFECRTGIVKPTLVVPKDPATLISHPDELRHVIRQHAKALFALTQFFGNQTLLLDFFAVTRLALGLLLTGVHLTPIHLSLQFSPAVGGWITSLLVDPSSRRRPSFATALQAMNGL